MPQLKDSPARRLRILMADRDVNTSELSYLSGVSVNTISRLRTGQSKRPNWDTVLAICDALHCKPRDIWYDR